MNGPLLTLQGSVMPDGTLELDSKLPLPPGRVQVTVKPVTEGKEKPSPREALMEILERRKSSGIPGRSKEEIDADLGAMREEWEQREKDLDKARRGNI